MQSRTTLQACSVYFTELRQKATATIQQIASDWTNERGRTDKEKEHAERPFMLTRINGQVHMVRHRWDEIIHLTSFLDPDPEDMAPGQRRTFDRLVQTGLIKAPGYMEDWIRRTSPSVLPAQVVGL